MRTYDLGTSLFWLFLSIAILTESLHLGIGTPSNPGMGFLAFCASGLLGLMSLGLFIQALRKEPEVKGEPFFSKLWTKVPIALIALLAYSNVMPLLGYLISTFLLMTFLFCLLEDNRKKWFLWPLVGSLLTTVLTYYVFSVWLNCQFPAGPFGF
jgi:uncharacterized membrane protein